MRPNKISTMLSDRRRDFYRRSFPVRHPVLYGSETVRQRITTADDRRLLHQIRGGRELCWEAHDEPEPLVTVRVATYNRGRLVAERALASAVAQTYERLEILVVGDHCDDATAKAVLGVGDPRIRFVNLAERGLYPDDAHRRWLVAGAAPMNAALALARGKWIAPCDDDDELTPDHVEVLLRSARGDRREFVWSSAEYETSPEHWVKTGDDRFAMGRITHGSVLYAAELRVFRHNVRSWKVDRPGDWDLWLRMRRAGVVMGFVDAMTYRHHRETAWRS